MNPLLIVYNGVCAALWAQLLYVTVGCWADGLTPSQTWGVMGEDLVRTQSLAGLEVVFSLVGLIRSPFLTTVLQVSSRLLLVHCFSKVYPGCQAHVSLFLMVISWACVEVPRYSFYLYNQFVKSSAHIPYPLFWLRYSLFMILYPSGISGEMLQMYTSLSESNSTSPVFYRLTLLILVLYVPGGPFMIKNMWTTRKKALRSRHNALNPRKANGITWPVTNEKTGERSTSKTNKAIWAEAVGSVDKDAQDRVEKERNWRFGYVKHVEANVRASLKSPQAALQVAAAGLASARAKFTFIRGDEQLSLSEACKKFTGSFETFTIVGEGQAPKDFGLKIPYTGDDPTKPYYVYKNNERVLEGDAILAQLDKWVAYGSIEPDCAEAIRACVENPKWMDLRDMHFVLLGATSAMGPLDILLAHGANVIAVDLDRDFIWKKIIAKTRASCGTVTFPLKRKPEGKKASDLSDDELAKAAGSDLLGDTPEICNWLKTVCPGKQLTVGNYTYLDGALHVQLSIACDLIIESLCEARKDTAVAFLCTPTDVHCIPKAAHQAAERNLAVALPGWLSMTKGLLSSKTRLVPNAIAPENGFYIVDGITGGQGPNYALAKRMQHWRAMLCRSRSHTVASSVAPSTATKSVVHAVTFAMAYGGMHHFVPIEVLYQETSNAVMGSLLIHELRNPKSAGNANTKLDNPLQLFQNTGFHGGVWRAPYKIGSIGEVAVLAYLAGNYSLHFVGGIAGISCTALWVLGHL